MKSLSIPLNKKIVARLKCGEEFLFSGIIYTARDQAHKRLVDLIKNKKKLPLDLKDKIIYYCGPTATPKGKAIGACGPTTSSRMDGFVEPLLNKGLIAMIGKGGRSRQVRQAITKHRAVYLLAPSGCGALLARKVISRRLVCFKDLGPEAVLELKVKDFPLIVGIDSRGRSIYQDV